MKKSISVIILMLLLLCGSFLFAQKSKPEPHWSISLGTNPNFVKPFSPTNSPEEIFSQPYLYLPFTYTTRSLPILLKGEVFVNSRLGLGFQVTYTSLFAMTAEFITAGGTTVPLSSPMSVSERLTESKFKHLDAMLFVRYLFRPRESKWNFYSEAGIGFLQFQHISYQKPFGFSEVLREGVELNNRDNRPFPNVQFGVLYKPGDRWGIDFGGNLRKVPFKSGLNAGLLASLQCYFYRKRR